MGAAPASVLDRESLVRYVLGRHVPGAGFCYYRVPEWGVEEPNAPDTFFALRSLGALGVDTPEPGRVAGWLRSLQREDGSFSTLVVGWAALRALALLGEEPRELPDRWLLAEASRLGGAVERREWSGTLWSALRLADLAGPRGIALDRGFVDRLLSRAADERGGWARPGGDLETTAVACELAASGSHEAEVVSRAGAYLDDCEHPVLGVRLTPYAGATTIGALRGGAILAQRLGRSLRHVAAARAAVAEAQRPSGGLGARAGAVATLRATWLGLEADLLLER